MDGRGRVRAMRRARALGARSRPPTPLPASRRPAHRVGDVLQQGVGRERRRRRGARRARARGRRAGVGHREPVGEAAAARPREAARGELGCGCRRKRALLFPVGPTSHAPETGSPPPPARAHSTRTAHKRQRHTSPKRGGQRGGRGHVGDRPPVRVRGRHTPSPVPRHAGGAAHGARRGRGARDRGCGGPRRARRGPPVRHVLVRVPRRDRGKGGGVDGRQRRHGPKRGRAARR